MARTVFAVVSKRLREMVKIALPNARVSRRSHELWPPATCVKQQVMKSIMLGICLLLAAALPARAEKAWVALSPIPYGFVAPQEIASHLSTGPLTGIWAEQVEKAGALASVAVLYQPDSGDKTILFTAYYFPADKWDAAQNPDEPPPFGQQVFRGDGRVLSVAGPHDTIFDPETSDGKNVIEASGLLQDPASFQPVD